MFQSDGVPIDVTQLRKAIDYSSVVWLLFFGAARVPQITHDGNLCVQVAKMQRLVRGAARLSRRK